MGNVVLSIFRCSLVLYSDVNSVQVVLSRLIMRLFSFVHVCICGSYSCMYVWLRFAGVWRCSYLIVSTTFLFFNELDLKQITGKPSLLSSELYSANI